MSCDEHFKALVDCYCNSKFDRFCIIILVIFLIENFILSLLTYTHRHTRIHTHIYIYTCTYVRTNARTTSSFQGFTSEEEAITIANDSAYGLAAAVFSADSTVCDRVSRRMRAGVVWQNCSQVS